MAAGKLLSRVVSFLSRSSSPQPHLRCLSTTATGVDLNTSPGKAVSILDFLRSRGLGDEVLASFAPRLLDSKVFKDLPAKFDLLLTLGFSVPEAAKVLRYNNLLRDISLISLQRRLDTLRTIVSDADLTRFINRARWSLSSGSKRIQRMVDNATKVRGWGVSEAKIRYFLVSQPRFFQLRPQSLDDAADRAEVEFGLRRDSKRFVDAVICRWTTAESTMQSKFKVFESLGWKRSGVQTLFKTNPTCLQLAEATLVKKLAFLMKEAGYDPSYIANRPVMLTLSLEKRVRPRFELVNALKSKNLLPKSLAFYSILCISERAFVEKYVVKFMKKEPAICNAYINTVAPLKGAEEMQLKDALLKDLLAKLKEVAL